MAILSKGIKLSYSSTGTESYTDLTDLLEIPSLGGSVDKVDVTTGVPSPAIDKWELLIRPLSNDLRRNSLEYQRHQGLRRPCLQVQLCQGAV